MNGDLAFPERLFTRILCHSQHVEPGVQDEWGMLRAPSARRRVGDALAALASRARLSRSHFDPLTAGERLARIASLSPGLARTHEMLADDASRELLLDILALRVLGARHVPLPVSQGDFRAACERIDRELREATAVESAPDGHPLHRYRIPARNGPVSLLGVAFLVHEFFGVEQYALHRDGAVVAADRGDVVIDGGGGWGETALYFADAVGESGRVLSFEFVPENLRLLERSLALNPGLRERIEVVPNPLWSTCGQRLPYSPAGGETSVTDPRGGELEAPTETIDHACAERGIEHVDFLKLDVEGAEMNALAGAEQTIRRCRPKLALSVYHRDLDLAQIPGWVDDLGLGYRLCLDHSWPGIAETVLFARPA